MQAAFRLFLFFTAIDGNKPFPGRILSELDLGLLIIQIFRFQNVAPFAVDPFVGTAFVALRRLGLFS